MRKITNHEYYSSLVKHSYTYLFNEERNNDVSVQDVNDAISVSELRKEVGFVS